MEQIEKLEGQALYERENGKERGNSQRGTYMLTYTQKEFYPLEPKIEDIEIKDIAHALGNICRFTGHVNQFYSVAQHCVMVSNLCEPENALCGLLHDASETYLCDVSRPVKYTDKMSGYREIEEILEKAISKKYNLPYPMPKDVKYADDMALIAEGYQLFKPVPAWIWRRLKEAGLEKPLVTIDVCWPPMVAKAQFMKRFLELNGVKISVPTQKELDEIDASSQES